MKNKDLSVTIQHLNQIQSNKPGSNKIHYAYMMGTLVFQKIWIENPYREDIIQETIGLLNSLERLMSFHDQNSQLNLINRLAGKSWIEIDPQLYFLISEAKRYAILTRGYFNIAIAPLIDLWNTYGQKDQAPPESCIQETLRMVTHEDIGLKENSCIKLMHARQKIDLGGIAKGYAANCIIDLYRRRGVGSGMINFGGSVSLLGKNNNGESWRIGIQDPSGEWGDPLAVLLTHSNSIVTSGDYERFFDQKKIYHHILNPKTGYPASNNLRSVTIIHPDAMLADVLSTAAFVLGLKQGIQTIQQFENAKFIFVDSENRIYLSRELIPDFQLIKKDYSLFEIESFI